MQFSKINEGAIEITQPVGRKRRRKKVAMHLLYYKKQEGDRHVIWADQF